MNNKFALGFGSVSDSDEEKPTKAPVQKKTKADKAQVRKPATAAEMKKQEQAKAEKKHKEAPHPDKEDSS